MKKDESGYTLIGVLAIFTIASIVAMTITMLALQSFKTSHKELEDQATFYIAEAGLHAKLERLKLIVRNINPAYNERSFYNQLYKDIFTLDGNYSTFETMNGKNPVADVKIEELDKNKGKYTLVSKGTIGNQSRIVEKEITIRWDSEDGKDEDEKENETPPFAVFITDKFEMNGGTIIGDIGTVNEHAHMTFPGGGLTHNGKIYVPPGKENDVIPHNDAPSDIMPIDSKYVFPSLPTFPKIPENYTKLPDEEKALNEHEKTDLILNNQLLITSYITNGHTLEMNENLAFDAIKINASRTLNIDIGNKDRELVVNELDMHGYIKLKGTGTLNLYVRDQINMRHGAINVLGKSEQMNIFYKGTKAFQLSGSQKIHGSIFAEKADLDLTASGGVFGNIFTGGENVQLSGASDANAQVFLAPNADVTFAGGSTLLGSIYSKSFSIEGGGQVRYPNCDKGDCDHFITDGPISLEAIHKGHHDSDNESTSKPVIHLSSTIERDEAMNTP